MQEKHVEALKVCDDFLKKHEDDLIVLETKGALLADRGNSYEALQIYRFIAESNPQSTNAYQNTTLLYMNLKQWDNALGECDKLLKLVPSDIKGLHKKAYILGELGKFSESLATCNRILSTTPKDASAYALRGYIYLKMKKQKTSYKRFNARSCFESK